MQIKGSLQLAIIRSNSRVNFRNLIVMNNRTTSRSNSRINQSKCEIKREIKNCSRVRIIKREAAAHLNKYRRNKTISSSINDSSASILGLQRTSTKKVTPTNKHSKEGDRRMLSQNTFDRRKLKHMNRPAINVKDGLDCKFWVIIK
jgi:hypothetical protein